MLVLLSPVLTLAAVGVGYLLGRRDPLRYIKPITPIGTAMPTGIEEPPPWS